jgi:predicted nuclease of predicted toxin-antitoxin system
MNIKLDENLPLRLATLLKDLGHDVHTLHDERLTGHADNEIWEAAQKESRFLITQDLDFSDSRRFAPGSHHGILVVRLHSPNRRHLIGRIGELFQSENVGDWARCFVVATERKIRVLRPVGKQNYEIRGTPDEGTKSGR